MINNPIFQRETKTTVRDPRTVTLLMAFLVSLGLLLMLLWPRSDIFSYSEASNSSMRIFLIFLMCNLALVILIVPALTSPTITTERENNSYSLLFMSLMTPGEILRGKLFSSISMVLLVVAISLPVSALCSLSGGIGPMILLKAFSVILLSALTYGLLGLAISALCKTTFTSLILTYIMVAVLAGATWLPYYLVGSYLQMLKHVWLLIRSLSPFDAIHYLMYPGRYELTQIADSALSPYMSFLLGNTILFVVFLVIFCRYVVSAPKPGVIYFWAGVIMMVLLVGVLAIEANIFMKYFKDPKGFLLKMPPIFQQINLIMVLAGLIDICILWIAVKLFKQGRHERQKSAEAFDDMKTSIKRKLTWPFYLFDPLKRKKPISLWRNPIFVAEMRSKIFAKPRFILFGIAGCMAIAICLLILISFSFATRIEPDTVRWVAIVFQIGVVAILAPAISSGSITDEMTSRTFLSLRMTPVSAVKVVFGKLKASFLYVSFFLISSLPVLLSLVYLDYSSDTVDNAMKEMHSTADSMNKSPAAADGKKVNKKKKKKQTQYQPPPSPGVMAKVKAMWQVRGQLMQAFWRVGAWCGILILATISFVTAGFTCSAFSDRTSTATALSYCYAAFICIVTLGALIPDLFSAGIKEFILTFNPVVAALRVSSDNMFSDLPETLWLNNLYLTGGLVLTFLLISSIRVYYIFTRRS